MAEESETPPGRLTELVIATNNPGKLRELRRLLEPLGMVVSSPKDVLPGPFAVAETGETFAANAELKARALAVATGRAALADDSGLEVDALGGRPGVRSARFAGEQATDAENNQLLLDLLQSVPDGKRSARFRCAIALCVPAHDVIIVEAASEGVVLREPRGEGGFGYDPLFFVPALGRSFAELAPLEKDAISHRGRALRKLVGVLSGPGPVRARKPLE